MNPTDNWDTPIPPSSLPSPTPPAPVKQLQLLDRGANVVDSTTSALTRVSNSSTFWANLLIPVIAYFITKFTGIPFPIELTGVAMGGYAVKEGLKARR